MLILMLRNHIFFYIFILLLSNYQFAHSQSFDEIENSYNYLEKDNEIALPYVKQYIHKAKTEKKYENLVSGYIDAVFFSSDVNIKLKYADSTIIAAKFSHDNDLITQAYLGKGIIYYFNFKKYKPALDEYIKAYQYSNKSRDQYLQHKVIYHMGVVKSYLGYYSEALDHFKKCILYFEPKTKLNIHPDDIYNNKKGYLNSVHQSIVCYRNLKNYKKVDSLIHVGLSVAGNSKDFELEKAYFLKCKGILDYNEEKYNEAIFELDNALPVIVKNKDFAWTSVSYFYRGKSYLAIGDKKKAVDNFLKVDSIFQKNNFILPELRENYELLIHNAKENNDPKKELYYTKSLLKADSVINKDFTYLSSRIHKEYDTRILIDSQKNLEHQNSWGKIFIFMLFVIVITLVILIYFRNKREQEIKLKYTELQKKLQKGLSIVPAAETKTEKNQKSPLSEVIVNEILEKLVRFENENGFIEKGMSLNKLAKKLNTNANYLSYIVNEKRGINFNKYLAELRINYITQKIYYEKKYLNYTVEGLAEECGIASRQNFSDLFFSINGIRPADFIKKRKAEL